MADIKLPDGEATGSSATRWSRATRLAVGTGVALMVVVGVLLLFLLTLATNNRLAYERNYNWLFAANVVVAGLLLLVLFWGGLRLALRLRRGRFGSKLLLKLAGIFTLVGLLPGLLIYVVSYQFVSRSIESWFDVKVEGALSAGVSLASATLDTVANDMANNTRTAGLQLSQTSDAGAALMLERIRDIRASERRVYLRVKEIFALAADYQPSLKETTQFFQTIQNKLHFACTGHTAAELIHKRADASQPHMGLTSYKGEEVRKGDVTVAKNYLTQDEVSELNRVVNMWLDFAEDQARRRQQVFLRDWQDKLDQFLQFNDREVLQGAGKISKKMADEKAQAEYGQFAEQQRRLKEAEGEKDIAGLLQWNKESKK